MEVKRKTTLLVTIGLCLALIVPTSVAWAYFTSYATTKGSVPITLGTQTDIKEDFKNETGDWTKILSVSNGSNSAPVFVRVQAFSGSTYELSYSGDSDWTPGADGYYYYAKPVEAGSSTTDLRVIIKNIPVDAKEGDEFNVIVVYETTLALYDADGKAYADWNTILDSGNALGGGTNE